MLRVARSQSTWPVTRGSHARDPLSLGPSLEVPVPLGSARPVVGSLSPGSLVVGSLALVVGSSHAWLGRSGSALADPARSLGYLSLGLLKHGSSARLVCARLARARVPAHVLYSYVMF